MGSSCHILFFGKNNCDEATWNKASDPPVNMLVAMTLGATLCVLVGVVPGFLYERLPYLTEYTPFTTYHLVETLQLLGFTALVFMLMKKLIEPVDKPSLDIDWFYRQGGRAFFWTAKHPIQATNTAWGEAYRYCALPLTMLLARLAGWFDWHIIDGLVDGLARSVRGLGNRVRLLQSGQMQFTFFYALSLVALLLATLSIFWIQ